MSNEHVIRMWRGVIHTADLEEYVAYVERTGVEQYRSTPGNIDAWTMTRELPGGLTEIMTVSRWDGRDSIERFAGENIERAVYYPEDDRFLVERDATVRHFVERGSDSVIHGGGTHRLHIPAPGEPSIPELEADETVAPRPEEEMADLLRTGLEDADHTHRSE